MDKQAALDELERRKAISLELGGPEKIAKLRKRGHITARERIDALVDPGTWKESGQLGLFKLPGSDQLFPASKLHGSGEIDGRRVSIQSDDSTVLAGTGSHGLHRGGGAGGGRGAGMPFIRFGESGGVHMQSVMGSVGLLGSATMPAATLKNPRMTPKAIGIMGMCFGDPTWWAAQADFVVQVKGTCMAVSGPRVLAVALEEKTTPQELGGWEVHAYTTGQIDAIAEDDEHCTRLLREFISYMPQNCNEETPRVPTKDPTDRATTRVAEIVPDSADRLYDEYDMEEVIKSLVDDGKYFIMKPLFGTGLIVCFARLNGYTVGIIASQPLSDGGAIGPDECDKALDMLVMCDSFNIPLVFLCDTPGYAVTKEADGKRFTIRAMHWQQALSMVTVPRLTIIVRKAHGVAATLMGAGGANYIVALSTADLRPMADGVALTTKANKSRIEAAADPEAEKAWILAEIGENASPFVGAMSGQVDDIIIPEDLRKRAISALGLTDAREGSGSFIGQKLLQHWPTGC